jgi:hypothetical protein
MDYEVMLGKARLTLPFSFTIDQAINFHQLVTRVHLRFRYVMQAWIEKGDIMLG